MAIEGDKKEQAADPVAAELDALKQIIQGRVTPEEITEAFLIVFQLFTMLSEDVDKRIDGNSKSAAGEVTGLRSEFTKSEEDRAKAYESMNKLIDGLVKWRKEIEAAGLVEDVELALDLAGDASDGLKQIQRELKKIKKSKGKDGKPGRMPDHEWEGTRLRFQKPDGSWGEFVDLRGLPGVSHPESGWGSGMTQLEAGSPNVVVRNGKIYVTDAGGAGDTVEIPAGTVNASNTVFTPTAEPKWVVADGVTYYDGAGYTWNGTTITMDIAPSIYIRAIVPTV